MLDDVRHQYDTEVSSLSSRLQVRDEEIARLNAHLNDTQQVMKIPASVTFCIKSNS